MGIRERVFFIIGNKIVQRGFVSEPLHSDFRLRVAEREVASFGIDPHEIQVLQVVEVLDLALNQYILGEILQILELHHHSLYNVLPIRV